MGSGQRSRKHRHMYLPYTTSFIATNYSLPGSSLGLTIRYCEAACCGAEDCQTMERDILSPSCSSRLISRQ